MRQQLRASGRMVLGKEQKTEKNSKKGLTYLDEVHII